MSRKRDTNWSKDEITVLLDSIMEVTKKSAEDGKKTNSREVFEYAAKKMAEKGHNARAEREKCRTKWKKMKEEFTHAKRSREGDLRYKEAPGIQPFYERMEEFINGNYNNISPHSTIVRRTSSLSSSKPSPSSGHRASARIAASSNGTSSTDNNDTSSTIVTKTTTVSSDYPSSITASPASRQNSRLSSGGSNNTNTTNNVNNITALQAATTSTSHHNNNSTTNNTNNNQGQNRQPSQPHQQISNQELCAIYTSYSNSNRATIDNNMNNAKHTNSNNIVRSATPTTTTSSSALNNSNESPPLHPTEHADISYRVSSGCRQITIFGDHDVDIKFRGDCVTINKIDGDFQAAET